MHENSIYTCKVMTLEPYLIPYTDLNSKNIKDINEKAKAIKVLEGNTGQNLYDTEIANDFLNTIPKEQVTKN